MSNINKKALEWWQSLSDEESDNILKENGILGHDQGVNEDEIVSFFKDVKNEKAQSADTQKCSKCGGRTALVFGYWYYSPDSEPYTNGIEEKAEVGDSEAWMNGFVCDDCTTIQDVFVDEEKYQSRISQLEQDLAKSQEKCKAYEDVLQDIAAGGNHLHDIYDKYNWCTEEAEQALKPKEDEQQQ